MLNLTKYVVRSLSASKKLFASTAVLASENIVSSTPNPPVQKPRKTKNPTVAAVFASLKDENQTLDQKVLDTTSGALNIDDVINNAKTVNGLLSVGDVSKMGFNRNHALKIVTVLAEWSASEKIKISEFENDERFVRLCRILGRNHKNSKSSNNGKNSTIEGFKTADINDVLAVTGDDEAAKMVARLSIEQMVKVFKNLGIKKRRSVPLLRSLSFNLSCKQENLNIKQCGDVLYALSSLNFPDSLVISKICVDVVEAFKKPVIKSSPVGSVITSLALLRYRDTFVLDAIVDWLVKNHELARVQDISAAIMSLAMLNYVPESHWNVLKDKLSTSISSVDLKHSFEYLNYCWSLMSLGFYHEKYFDSVLNADFIEKLKSENSELTHATKMKLLNINAGVKLLLPNYNGAMMDKEKFKEVYDLLLIHNKDKVAIVNSVTEALKSLVPSNSLKLNTNTNMGFVIDAEFFVDKDGKACANEMPDGKKIAMIIQDFRDVCQGSHQILNGIASLNMRLLEKAGYHVITVPFSDLSEGQKVLKRVQYLETRIKGISRK